MSRGASNQEIARVLAMVAGVLEKQGAPEGLVRPWLAGADAVAALEGPIAERFAAGGRPALEAVPGVGRKLAAVLAEVVTTGHTRILERLHADLSAVDLLAEIPGLGPVLARRIRRQLGIDTLEELAQAAEDGRLLAVSGFGERRVRVVAELLASRLGGAPMGRASLPPLPLILDVDRRYREHAEAGALHRVAARHVEPGAEIWVPILHEQQGDWDLTVLYSSTPLARQLGKSHDWVVVYHDREGEAGRSTVVTATEGVLAGRRVVRGREHETPLPTAVPYGAVVARM